MVEFSHQHALLQMEAILNLSRLHNSLMLTIIDHDDVYQVRVMQEQKMVIKY